MKFRIIMTFAAILVIGVMAFALQSHQKGSTEQQSTSQDGGQQQDQGSSSFSGIGK